MIGLDTNVVVRYVMQDDAKQSQQATRLIESLSSDEPGFFSVVSIAEFSWVLETCYGLSKAQQLSALEGVLRTKEFVVEDAETVWRAIRACRAGAGDFANCLIANAAKAAGCNLVMTFDKSAAKNAGMALVT
jgi:predicted nucleic-acid-binding protein